MNVRGVHGDWYGDGVEDGENLFRLDLKVGQNAFQVQLFLSNKSPAKSDAGSLLPALILDGSIYYSARLFLERDNRDESGEKRIDYACDCKEISLDEASFVLSGDRADFRLGQRVFISGVAGMPCRPEYL